MSQLTSRVVQSESRDQSQSCRLIHITGAFPLITEHSLNSGCLLRQCHQASATIFKHSNNRDCVRKQQRAFYYTWCSYKYVAGYIKSTRLCRYCSCKKCMFLSGLRLIHWKCGHYTLHTAQSKSICLLRYLSTGEVREGWLRLVKVKLPG